MLINWFTVITQIINFLILAWLLKRFLYQPILAAIDAREKLVADKLATAEADVAAAQQEKAEFDRKNEDFEKQRADLLRQAEDEVRQQRLHMSEKARQEVEEQRIRWLEALNSNQQTMRQAIGIRTKREIFAIARQTLRDLAGVDLEERVLEVFMARLRGLDRGEKANLLAAASPGQTVIIRTVCDLTEEQKALLEKTIQATLSSQYPVRFESEPTQIAGIELLINDRKVEWSIDNYLISLEDNIGELINSQFPTLTTGRMAKDRNIPQGEITHEQ